MMVGGSELFSFRRLTVGPTWIFYYFVCPFQPFPPVPPTPEHRGLLQCGERPGGLAKIRKIRASEDRMGWKCVVT